MIVLVEQVGPGAWRYGTETTDGAAWTGAARRSAEHDGLDLAGPWDLEPTVRLLIRDRPDEQRIRYDTTDVPARERRPVPARPAGQWQRATAGLAKGQGRSLGEMANSGRMGR